MYLGVHYPLDILGGAGIGIAAAGVILLALGALLRARTGLRPATTPRRPGSPGPDPSIAAAGEAGYRGAMSWPCHVHRCPAKPPLARCPG